MRDRKTISIKALTHEAADDFHLEGESRTEWVERAAAALYETYIILRSGFIWLIFTGLTVIMMILSVIQW